MKSALTIVVFVIVSLYGFRLHFRSRGWKVRIGRVNGGDDE